jgi:hypothetical protein
MVNEWNKTALVAEFETMLRRRLKNGAAPVAACAGFDLDAASAYIEGALGGSHRADYESHLAGCATCRRHLIELTRLAQNATLGEAPPVAPPDRISTWQRWKEAVAGWVEVSSRSFKWQMAGAAGAAFAILLGALGAQSWRHGSKQSNATVAQDTAAQIHLEPTPQPLQSQSPAPLSADMGAYSAEEAIAINREAQSRVPTPAPQVGPQGPTPTVPVEPSPSSLALPNLSGEAPSIITPAPTAPEAARTPAPRMGATVEAESLASVSRPVLIDDATVLKEEAARMVEDPVKGLRPSPPRGLNPMEPGPPGPVVSRRGLAVLGGQQAKPNMEPGSKSFDTLARIKDAVSTLVKRNPVKWPFNSDSEQKAIGGAQESLDAESANAMVWRFRGKVFIFRKDTWIDQEYKPEMQQWRRWTLTRNSDEYKRALAGEPQLKEFFDKGPILIVWKNRIYKVLK